MQTPEEAIVDTKKLHQALSLVSESFAEAGVPWIADSIDSMINQELELALQFLCSNLHEFGCPVPRLAYELIEQVGHNCVGTEWARSLGLETDTWEMLMPQVQS